MLLTLLSVLLNLSWDFQGVALVPFWKILQSCQ